MPDVPDSLRVCPVDGCHAVESGRPGREVVCHGLIREHEPTAMVTYVPKAALDAERQKGRVMGRRDQADELERLREAARGLARWTQHHPSCARVIEAGMCSCGLQEAWEALGEGG